jgi:catechol 2,3-dioxygenase-like lactoylglutathione lyase family enzyme
LVFKLSFAIWQRADLFVSSGSGHYNQIIMTLLHHVDIIIPVGSDSEAREFYCVLLGLVEIEKPEALKKNGGMWLNLGNAQIHLSYEKKAGVDPRKTKAHIAFAVSDLIKVEKTLLAHGFPVNHQGPLPGMIRFETVDPFGHRLELLQII